MFPTPGSRKSGWNRKEIINFVFNHWQDLLVCLHMAGSWAGCPCFLGATISLNNLD